MITIGGVIAPGYWARPGIKEGEKKDMKDKSNIKNKKQQFYKKVDAIRRERGIPLLDFTEELAKKKICRNVIEEINKAGSEFPDLNEIEILAQTLGVDTQTLIKMDPLTEAKK